MVELERTSWDEINLYLRNLRVFLVNGSQYQLDMSKQNLALGRAGPAAIYERNSLSLDDQIRLIDQITAFGLMKEKKHDSTTS
jgi:hypothetical protein